METLVLNSAYMPINRVPWMEAIGDLLTGRAEVIETYDDRTAAVSEIILDLPKAFEALRTDVLGVWKIPSIIRFVTKAVFRRRNVKFNRHNVWLRDKCRCQYCNRKLKLDEFTYDHVQPQSKGGETNWLNIVVACVDCNHHKANRTPEEARMRLKREPYKPMHLPGHTSPALSWKTGMPDCWKSFLASVSYWHGKLD
jgi:5-methylcytosine-specific restriction endonuclease McrA